ncbi:AMP-binding protein [Yaniella halotolerans]|uniref:AMP-binding protein n=1 Tax=Yaniella halotolerans TaxID=225453 RepID=UPI0003B79767|nr:AMP-binding protein [Yaniella halotolerans]
MGEEKSQQPGTAYRAVLEQSIQQPAEFWLEQAELLDWHTAPTRGLDYDGAESWKWYPDGRLNITYQALDRWVKNGRGDQPALIWDSAMTDQKITYTYAELLDQVARLAAALRAQGIEHGDRVLIYMPMIPEALIAMLAVARLGAIHVVTFGGFAPKEVATRLDDAQAKAVIAANGGIEPSRPIRYLPNVAEAIEMAEHKPEVVFIKQRPEIDDNIADFDPAWLDFDEQLAAQQPVDAVPVAATAPLYLLHTSGTTSKPKAVIRDHGGYAVASAWSVPHIYDVAAGETMFVASDVGWVVGHTYIVYAPLVAGATTVVYEGKPVGTPDAGAFWRVASEHQAKMIFSAPTAYRAIRAADPHGEQWEKYDMSALRNVFSAGERLDEDTYHWLAEVTGKPIVDHWWQTETGWPIVANLRGLDPMPMKPGSSSVAVPGYDVGVVNPLGEPVGPGNEGNIVIKLPLPPGAMVGLYGEPERFHSSYMAAFPGYYETGDTGYIDEDGYVFVLGRSDDVINVAGHRLSTGTLESVIADHPVVAETAVIGVADGIKGQKPVAYVVLTAGADITPEQLSKELVAKVRKDFGAVAAFRDVEVVSALPKTRSGKILRRTMRSIVEGEDFSAPATIDDPDVLESFAGQTRRWEI